MNSEQYIAGAILISGEQVLGAIRGLVTAECFRLESCRAIFTAGESLLEQGQPIDPVSVAAEARRQGVELPNSLLAELMEIVPTAANCVDYAHRVAEDARKRRIKELAGRIQSDTVSTSDELLAAMQREAQAIQGSSFQRGLLSPNDTLRRFMDYVVNAGKNRDNFLSSGFPGPAVGKTTFALNLADNMAGNTLLVSLEMSPEQLTAKRVSGLTGYPAARLLSGDLEDEDRVWEAVAMAATVLGQKGVYVNNRYDLTVQQIHLLAQSVPQLRCVILDYLGLIQPANRTGSTYEQVSQKEYEMRALRAQINPHFLYNSLSLINWKAIESGQEDISRITLELSNYYRTSLNKGRNTLTLEQELSNVRSYLQIQQLMHDGDFDVEIDVAAEILQYESLNLILQPLVENAIDHGIDLKTEGRGRITIRGWQEPAQKPLTHRTDMESDTQSETKSGTESRREPDVESGTDYLVVLTVSDNGVGMDKQTAADFLTVQSGGYGARNVNERLKLYYGDQYPLKVDSKQGEGTTITITFPARVYTTQKQA